MGMGSRLLPLSLALATLVADAAGLHRIAFYLVLFAVIGGTGAAFSAVAELLERGGGVARAVTTSLAAALLVLGSAVRAGAAVGSHVPALAVSAVGAAILLYALPALGSFVAPAVPKPARAPQRARAVLR